MASFFADVIDNWSVATDQSTDIKSSDLQIAKMSDSLFTMTHQMGLLKGSIPNATTADNVIVYDGNTYNSSASGEKWTRISNECTTITWNASTTFTSSTNKPYNDTSNKILYYIAKPADNTISISSSAGTQLYAWSVSGDNTTVSTKNVCKTFSISTPDYSNAFNKKIWKFDYAGSIKTWVAPHEGSYTMECWGAQGGTNVSIGGKGGYSIGTNSFSNGFYLYVCVGSKGEDGTTSGGGNGGYNGGGNGGGHSGSHKYGGGGGGATHIATISGILSTLSSNSTAVLLVAGGGGGGGHATGSNVGGAGGGETGEDVKNYANVVIKGGGQTYNSSAGNFGLGVSAVKMTGGGYGNSGCGGGGGGWYGGGAQLSTGENTQADGAGGSGYIATSSGNTISGLSSFDAPDGTSETGHSGNGYARITYENP